MCVVKNGSNLFRKKCLKLCIHTFLNYRLLCRRLIKIFKVPCNFLFMFVPIATLGEQEMTLSEQQF